MPLELCPICARMHYSTDACKEPVRLTPDESAAMQRALMRSVHIVDPAIAANPLERISKANGPDDTQQPVRSNTQLANDLSTASRKLKQDMQPSSTPKPNRNLYHKLNMRKWRAAKKALTSQVVN